MKSTSGSSTRLSRRAVIGAAVAGAGLVALPRSLRAGAADGAPIHALAFDGDALLVARQTLSRSDDDGASWISEPAPDAGDILALATHPDRPGRIIAGMQIGGVAVSEDGGLSWEARSGGLPGEAVTAIAVAAAPPDTLYAAVRGDGLWQSEDAGRSWTFVMDRPWLGQAERDPMALASVNLATGMGGIWIYAGADRTSCTSAAANQLRLFLHAGAYWLMWTLRAALPRRSPWRRAQFDTLRLRLVKIAARVVEMKTRITVHLPSACPAAPVMRLLLERLPRMAPI